MNIQNNLSSTNFQANRSMIITSLNKANTPAFEIFRLNPTDIDFAEKYINKINQKTYTNRPKSNIIKFFKTFLKKITTSTRNQQDFYIGVKNGKELAGVFSIDQANRKILWVKDLFFTNIKDTFSKDSIFYFLIKKASRNPVKPIYGINKTANTLVSGKDLLYKANLPEKENMIEKKYTEFIFYTIKKRSNNEINLQDILD